MATKREEERNEKIIRGLMKLPPNRRCINCNSLGPQYVCINFWTFVCMICSGIHREFTHRVKSVSMSKFNSQEVEALQNGGNQRARETYLKDWDLRGQRLPNSSDVDKVRDFIKAVYVNRKYAGGNKSEKLPKEMQSENNVADEARRASSYHSYSQSPPYDFQYEDRLNRKQGGSLSRKPGSDHSLYARKAVSFVYSPGRFSDHHYEDKFANEGSSSRVSDYSVSSGGDPFRSTPQSPNFQKDDGFSSPASDSSREIDGLQRQTSNLCSEGVVKRDADRVPAPRPQRIVPSGIFGPFDKITGSLQSVGSGRALDGGMEPNLSVVNNQNKISEPSEATDEGWATFDSPQPCKTATFTPTSGATGTHSEVEITSNNLDSVSSANIGLHWSNFENIAIHGPGAAVNSWDECLHTNIASNVASSEWKAFEQTNEQKHQFVAKQGINLHVSVGSASSTFDLFQGPKMAKDCTTDGVHKLASNEGFSFPTLPSHVSSESTFNQPIQPIKADVPIISNRSVNPFDASFDVEFEANNTFLNTSSLQSALPSTTPPSPYAGVINESWFPLNHMESQGSVSVITAQAPSSQLANVPSHEPVASLGGNPFA